MYVVETRGLILGWVPVSLWESAQRAKSWAARELSTKWRVRRVSKWML